MIGDNPEDDLLAGIGESLDDALDKAQSPLAALVALYNHAPHPVIREFLDSRAKEIVETDLPKIYHMLEAGPAADREELGSLAEVFEAAMTSIAAEDPQAVPSATAQQIGRDLAAFIDQNLGRVLLEETQFNRKCWHDIVSSHATLTAALDGLALTEDQKKLLDEWEEGAESYASATLH